MKHTRDFVLICATELHIEHQQHFLHIVESVSYRFH